jgi:hypothetical protein
MVAEIDASLQKELFQLLHRCLIAFVGLHKETIILRRNYERIALGMLWYLGNEIPLPTGLVRYEAP